METRKWLICLKYDYNLRKLFYIPFSIFTEFIINIIFKIIKSKPPASEKPQKHP